MTLIGWIQIVLYCAIVAALIIPLGGYMTRVFNGDARSFPPCFARLNPFCIGSAALTTSMSSIG